MVQDVYISTDCKMMVSSGMNGKVYLWTEYFDEPIVYSNHAEPVCCVYLCMEPLLFASGSTDNTVVVTCPTTQNSAGYQHLGFISSVTITSEAKYVIAAAENAGVRIWDRMTGDCKWSIPCDDCFITTVKLSYDYNKLLWSDACGSLYVSNFQASSIMRSNLNQRLTVNSFSEDGTLVCIGAMDGSVQLWFNEGQDWSSWNLLWSSYPRNLHLELQNSDITGSRNITKKNISLFLQRGGFFRNVDRKNTDHFLLTSDESNVIIENETEKMFDNLMSELDALMSMISENDSGKGVERIDFISDSEEEHSHEDDYRTDEFNY